MPKITWLVSLVQHHPFRTTCWLNHRLLWRSIPKFNQLSTVTRPFVGWMKIYSRSMFNIKPKDSNILVSTSSCRVDQRHEIFPAPSMQYNNQRFLMGTIGNSTVPSHYTTWLKSVSLLWVIKIPSKFTSRSSLYGSVSKPCTPGEHQNSW